MLRDCWLRNLRNYHKLCATSDITCYTWRYLRSSCEVNANIRTIVLRCWWHCQKHRNLRGNPNHFRTELHQLICQCCSASSFFLVWTGSNGVLAVLGAALLIIISVSRCYLKRTIISFSTQPLCNRDKNLLGSFLTSLKLGKASNWFWPKRIFSSKRACKFPWSRSCQQIGVWMIPVCASGCALQDKNLEFGEAVWKLGTNRLDQLTPDLMIQSDLSTFPQFSRSSCCCSKFSECGTE